MTVQLTTAYGKGFSTRNLWYYRQFYTLLPNWEIVNTRVQNLTWSHIRTLLRVTDEKARML